MKLVWNSLLLLFAVVFRTTDSTRIDSACLNTLYPDVCMSALASVTLGTKKTPRELFDVSVRFAMSHVHYILKSAYNITFSPPDPANDCVELLHDTLEHLANALHLSASDDDIQTWLSAAMTNQATCLESLAMKPPFKMATKEVVINQPVYLAQSISNSLALFRSMNRNRGSHRKLWSNAYPRWLSIQDRKLIEASQEEIKFHAVVAVDGSGTHKSINEALAFASLASGRTVIHIKAGTYHEYIRVPTKQKNVMLVGDGKGRSVIVGSRSNSDGWSTYQSATVAGMGAGFIARDLTIINDAGPSKQQAVALRVGADRAVIYRCSIQGYQDTLYVHSNRQFYTQNDIYGTVDFIFGNAAACLQSCNIFPRKPDQGQRNSITAQGRQDPNQNTGIVIQGCRIAATPELAGIKGHVPTYLGRPWHKYSRVVIMQSYMDDSINSAGWEPWSGSFATSTLYYGEYANTGPGSSTAGRVRWAGVHPTLSTSEAAQFTVARFIAGNTWLPGTGVVYKVGL